MKKINLDLINLVLQALILIMVILTFYSCNQQKEFEIPEVNTDSIVKYQTNKRIDKAMDSLKWYKDSLELDLLKFRCKKAGL